MELQRRENDGSYQLLFQLEIDNFPHLPQELIMIILEYYATSPKDLIRFGCVCQQWRDSMLISPLWSHGFGRKFQSPPRTISTKFQNRIYFWNQKISRRSGHISLISVSDSFLILSCLSFGVNWKISISTMIHSFGFFTAYLALICSIFAFRLQDEVDSSLLFAYTVFTLLLLIAIVLSQIKLMVPHFFPTLEWVDVFSPLYLMFVLFTIIWLQALLKDRKLSTLLPYGIISLIVLPPLLTLSLYGLYLDHPHAAVFSLLSTSFHPSQLINLIAPHLFVIFLFFSCFGSLLLYRLLCNVTRIPTSSYPLCLVLLLSILTGLLSITLFYVQSFPSLRIAWLSRSFNFIFYLFLLAESVAMTAMKGEQLNQEIGGLFLPLWSQQ
jgi:hypothetical protein